MNTEMFRMLKPKSSHRIKRRRHRRYKSAKWLSLPYAVWMIGFIIIPLIVIVYYGLTTVDNRFTLDNISAISSPINLKALLMALEQSLISTIICLLLAYPLAMILSKSRMRSSSFIVMIIILPMWMNFLLRPLRGRICLKDRALSIRY